MDRRRVLRWTARLPAAIAASKCLGASKYPARPLRLIVGFPPGGAGDTLARIIAQWLSGRVDQPVIVENIPGAGSMVATRAIVNAPADGHTLLLAGSSTIVSALLHERGQPALLENIIPVAGLTTSPFVIVVHSSAAERTVADLISYAKAHPGILKVGSYGVGTQSHLAASAFCRHAGIDVAFIPYRGGAPLINDLIGRHIDVAFDSVGNVLPQINAGILRALAVTSSRPLNHSLPTVPAAIEVVPDYEVVVWTALVMQKNTPLDIVERLNKECTAALDDPTIRARLVDLAFDPMPRSYDEIFAFWLEEVSNTRKLILDAGMKPD